MKGTTTRAILFFFFLASLTLLIGCSVKPPTLSFSGNPGEEQTYQHFVHEYGHKNPQDSFSGYAKKTYSILEDEKGHKSLHIKPEFYSSGASFLWRPQSGVSRGLPHNRKHWKEARTLSLITRLNPDSSAKNPKESLNTRANRSERILQAFHFDDLHQLSFRHALPNREKKQVTLTTEGYFSELVIKVIEFTDQYTYLQLEADTQEAKLFGYQVINRNTGWLHRSIFIAEFETDEPSSPITLMSSLYPQHWNLATTVNESSSLLPRNQSFLTPQEVDSIQNITKEMVFPDSELHPHLEQDILATLVYPHAIHTTTPAGRTQLDIETNNPGLSVAVEFAGSYDVGTLRGNNQPQINSEFRVHQLAWDPEAVPREEAPQLEMDGQPLTKEEIKQFMTHSTSRDPNLCLESPTIHASYYPWQLVKTQRVPILTNQTFNHRGAQLQLLGSERKSEFTRVKTRFFADENSFIAIETPNPSRVRSIFTEDNLPDWLTRTEKAQLEKTRTGTSRASTYWVYGESLPSINVMFFELSDQPAFTKQLHLKCEFW